MQYTIAEMALPYSAMIGKNLHLLLSKLYPWAKDHVVLSLIEPRQVNVNQIGG